MTTSRYGVRSFIAELAMILFACAVLIPFYFVLVNSFKTLNEVLNDATAWPREWLTDNYHLAWKALDYPKIFMNSSAVTIASVSILIIFGSMTAWRLARYPSKISWVIYLLFVTSLIIPFQTIMIPLMMLAGKLHLVNHIPGLIIMYMGTGLPFTMFLFHGYIKTVPIEVEEAAIVDGCSTFRLFWNIVFPLLKPIAATAIVLNCLWIWNDFLLPLLTLSDRDLRTIPVAIYSFFGQYSKKWELAMAALTMSIVPVLILFLALQKHIVNGVAAGSVKG